MANFSKCLSIIWRLPKADQDALLARLEVLQAQGTEPAQAQLQAALDVMSSIQREAGDVVRSAPRFVERDGVRFNPDLPRGYANHNAPEIEAARQARETAQAAASDAWAKGMETVRDLARERLQAFGLSEKEQEALLGGGPHMLMQLANVDEKDHDAFAAYRALADQAGEAGRAMCDRIAENFGKPEFDSMRQLADIDRPQTKTPPFRAWFGSSKVFGQVLYPVYLSIRNPAEYEGYEDLTDAREEAGGGQYRDDWVAFRPNPIKSALGNDGDFDPGSDDVVESERRPEGLQIVEVEDGLYQAFHEKHGGRILPSGKISPDAGSLWKAKYPERVDAFVRAEAGASATALTRSWWRATSPTPRWRAA